MEKMFERAIRDKFRFSYKGMITVEDLWDLTVQELDKIYKALKREAKVLDEDSLLTMSKVDEVLSMKIEIIKYIVAVKLQEIDAREKAAEKASQKKKIMSIIATKQDEALQSKSIEELMGMISEL